MGLLNHWVYHFDHFWLRFSGVLSIFYPNHGGRRFLEDRTLIVGLFHSGYEKAQARWTFLGTYVLGSWSYSRGVFVLQCRLILVVKSCFQAFFYGITSERLTMRLRSHLFRNIMRMDISYFDMPHHSSGKISTRLATDAPNVKTVGFFTCFKIGHSRLLITVSVVSYKPLSP